MRKQIWMIAAAITASLALVPAQSAAQKVNCANEYRSGKLYFSQYKDSQRKEGKANTRVGLGEETRTLLDKAVEHFGLAVESCPMKDAEYRWNYGIALGEAGLVDFENAAVTPMVEERNQLLDKAADYLKRAGDEFDAVPETENGQKKKQLKMARENRKYFWTELYNHGLDRAKNEDLETAAKYLQAAVAMDPRDVRAYHQGAIITFNAGNTEQAAKMVKEALSLDIDPTNKEMAALLEEHRPKLEELQLALFNELARTTLEEAKSENSVDKLKKALDYYNTLVEAEPDNPNHIYGRGVGHMAGGKMLADTDSTASREHYQAAAKDLEKAADMVTTEQDAAFHESAVRAAMYAYKDAGDDEKALVLNRRYACLDPLNAAAWRGLARIYVANGEQDLGVAALVMSKALGGTEVPVDVAVENATDDAKAALAELGNPSQVRSYQDGDNFITTFIWEDKHVARHYVLGKVQQEVTWCD